MSDKRKTRIAIMTKGQLFACFALDTNCPTTDKSTVNAVGMIDLRCNPAVDLRGFSTPVLAGARFHDLMAISREKKSVSHPTETTWVEMNTSISPIGQYHPAQYAARMSV